MTYKFLKTRISVTSDLRISKNKRYYFFNAILFSKGTHWYKAHALCTIHRPCISEHMANRIKPGCIFACRGDIVIMKPSTYTEKAKRKYDIAKIKFIKDELSPGNIEDINVKLIIGNNER